MKVIFMGTPDFSVGTLEALVEAGHEVCLAVTQPDKPKGRGKAMQFPPVKEAAIRHGIPVFQPQKVRTPECVEYLKGFQAEVFVVVAFGQILPKEILEMAPYGCINVHASLLPRYRGAAPIQWAILSGEDVTGVTTMQMDEGLDTGDMLLKAEVLITAEETGESLHDKLAAAGARLAVETLEKLEAGTLCPQKQGESPTPYAKLQDRRCRACHIGKGCRAQYGFCLFHFFRIQHPCLLKHFHGTAGSVKLHWKRHDLEQHCRRKQQNPHIDKKHR